MEGYIDYERHNAEIDVLNREISDLRRQIEEHEMYYTKPRETDPFDPFDNPTEYKDYSGDYSKIQPRISLPGYELPLEPDNAERKKIRRNYNIAGWMVIAQFALSLALAFALTNGLYLLIQLINPNADYSDISGYMYSSSILIAVNMLIYLVCNVGNAFLGLKWAGIKPSTMVQTRDFGFGYALQYCLIALFLWLVSIYSIVVINDVFGKYGIDTLVDQTGLGTSVMGQAVTIIYTCIIAPVTEEMFFRGMLLKVLSNSNQRFAIIASAFFFGLAHGNIPQFVLAFLLGMFLAHITMKHNSIIPSVIVHIFVNSLSTGYGYISKGDNMVILLFTLALLAAAALGLILLLVFRSTDKLPTPTPKQGRRGISIASSSIPFMIAAAIQIISAVYTLLKK